VENAEDVLELLRTLGPVPMSSPQEVRTEEENGFPLSALGRGGAEPIGTAGSCSGGSRGRGFEVH